MAEKNIPEETAQDIQDTTVGPWHGGGSEPEPLEASDLPRVAAPVDIYENEDEYLVVADVPGSAPDRIDIRLENGRLELRADQVERDGLLAVRFVRSFQVPDTIDPEGVSASYDQGVLSIHLAKGAHAKPRRIQVKSS